MLKVSSHLGGQDHVYDGLPQCPELGPAHGGGTHFIRNNITYRRVGEAFYSSLLLAEVLFAGDLRTDPRLQGQDQPSK